MVVQNSIGNSLQWIPEYTNWHSLQAPLSYILQQNSTAFVFDTDLNLVEDCPPWFERPWNSSTQVFNIATLLQSGMEFLEPSNMWLSLLALDSSPVVASALLQYSKPFQLNAGTMRTGFLGISMRREIDPSFLDMVGLKPVRKRLVIHGNWLKISL